VIVDPITLPLLAALALPPPVTLQRAAAYEKDITHCEFNDGIVRLEVSPRQMVRDGYDSRMRCEHLRCLLDTGETCWD